MQKLTIKCTCGASYDIPESVVVDKGDTGKLAEDLMDKLAEVVYRAGDLGECHDEIAVTIHEWINRR